MKGIFKTRPCCLISSCWEGVAGAVPRSAEVERPPCPEAVAGLQRPDHGEGCSAGDDARERVSKCTVGNVGCSPGESISCPPLKSSGASESATLQGFLGSVVRGFGVCGEGFWGLWRGFLQPPGKRTWAALVQAEQG